MSSRAPRPCCVSGVHSSGFRGRDATPRDTAAVRRPGVAAIALFAGFPRSLLYESAPLGSSAGRSGRTRRSSCVAQPQRQNANWRCQGCSKSRGGEPTRTSLRWCSCSNAWARSYSSRANGIFQAGAGDDRRSSWRSTRRRGGALSRQFPDRLRGRAESIDGVYSRQSRFTVESSRQSQ